MNLHSARRALAAAVAAALAAGALGACSDKLESGAACPALCPGQSVPLQDTTLSAAVVVDTTVVGYPGRGNDVYLLVADRGSDLQSRAVVRFDTLTTKFNRTATDTAVAITEVFGSNLRLVVDSAGSLVTAPVTINVYDVDTPAPSADDDAAVLAQFTSSRLIGSLTFAKIPTATDSLIVPLDDAVVLAKITGGQRLRVGLQVTSSAPAQLKIYAVESGTAAQLRYDPTVTTDSVAAVTVAPRSSTPATVPTVAAALRDYTIIAGGPRPLESDALAVGGLPARRVYFRFDVPKWLLDSSTVVRATLLLTQRPVANVDPATAISIVPAAVIAGTDVVDIGRASNILADTVFGALSTVALAPKDSGVRAFELGTLLRNWRTVGGSRPLQHAVVLRSRTEGVAAGEVRFFSTDAPADTLRPRLRVTYVRRVDFGVP